MPTEYDRNSARKAAAVGDLLRKLYGNQEISEMRMEHLLFLADWFHALVYGKPMSGLRWETKAGMRIAIKKPERNCLSRELSDYTLTDSEEKLVIMVSEKTKHLLITGVIDLVCGCYPLTKPTIYVDIDLEADAIEYHAKSAANSHPD